MGGPLPFTGCEFDTFLLPCSVPVSHSTTGEDLPLAFSACYRPHLTWAFIPVHTTCRRGTIPAFLSPRIHRSSFVLHSAAFRYLLRSNVGPLPFYSQLPSCLPRRRKRPELLCTHIAHTLYERRKANTTAHCDATTCMPLLSVRVCILLIG